MAPTTRGLQEEEYDIARSWKKKSRSGQSTLHTKGSVKTKENNKNEKTSGIETSGRPAEDENVKRTSGNRPSGRPAASRGRDHREDFPRRAQQSRAPRDVEPRLSGRPAARRRRDRRGDFSRRARQRHRASRRRRTQTKRRRTIGSDSAKQRWAWTETFEQSPHKLVGSCRVSRALGRRAANVEGRPYRWYISVKR